MRQVIDRDAHHPQGAKSLMRIANAEKIRALKAARLPLDKGLSLEKVARRQAHQTVQSQP